MPVNHARLAVNKALFIVETAILAVQLALNDNPAPDEAIELMQLLADLTTLKNQLEAQRIQLESAGRTIQPPAPEVIAEVATLTPRVEAATNAGAAASARIAVAGEALSAATKVMTHFG